MEQQTDVNLENGLKKIKEQAFHINSAIEKNNLRQCLKEAYTMICELRTNDLSPKNYYNLYMSVFDNMLIIKNYMIEEISRGRRLIDLYDDVQQAQHVIPRLYLMITVGSIYMEKVPRSTRTIIYDMLGLVKSVQNPIKGLFVRNYLLKMIKDKLPDKDNIYIREGAAFDDSLKFIIQNMEEMTRLWIRLSTGVGGGEKMRREKERDELKILIGESINKLSSLENLNLDLYEHNVLPKLLNIIRESNDRLCQQYLLECIIHAFPDSFNVKCMEILLESISNVVQGVDIGNIFVSLMQKLGNYFGRQGKNGNLEDNTEEILKTAQNIYPMLSRNFDGLIEQNLSRKDMMDLNKLLNLVSSFMKFSIQCSSQDQKIENVNHILALTVQIINKQKYKLNEDCVNKIGQLLFDPVKNCINVFKMNDFLTLINYLDYSNKKTLGMTLIETLVKDKNKNVKDQSFEKIDSLESLDKVLKYIQPLLGDSKNSPQDDFIAFEYEQNIVSKIIYLVQTNSLEDIYRIYCDLKNIFSHGGANRRQFTLPPLANVVIEFAHKISLCYENKANLLTDKEKKNIHVQEIVNSLDITKVENDEIFCKIMTNNYKLLNEILDLIAQEQPLIAYKLFLYATSQANSIKAVKEKFQETCMNFIKNALNILDEDRYDPNNKYQMLIDICNTVNSLTLEKESIDEILQEVLKNAQKLQRREDQCEIMLIISHLYYNIFKDGKKVMDCISKARRFADFAMTNPRNLILFVKYLNKLLYFVESGGVEIIGIKPELIEDIVELIRGHIRTIKNIPSDDMNYLYGIEKYYNNTIKLIKNRKNTSEYKDFYTAIKI